MKIMYKIKAALLMMALPVVANAQNQVTLSASDFDIEPGKTATFAVSMENEGETIWGAQFDMEMPDGITFKSAEVASARANGRTLSHNNNKNTNYNDHIVIQGNITNLETGFTGNAGPIAYITVEASSSFKTGKIGFSKIYFVNTAGTSISGAAFNVIQNPNMVETLEGVKMYVEGNVTLEEMLDDNKNTVYQGVLPVLLDNPKFMPNAIEFKLSLPDGVKVAKAETTDRSANLTLIKSEKDGKTKIIMTDASTLKTISGNEGAICNLTLQATDKNFKSGQVVISNIKLSNIDNLGYGVTFDDITVTVSSTAGIENAVVNEQMKGNVYNLQGVKVATSLEGLSKGVYIQNGKKIVKN